jgi:hypothetical protein
VTLCRGLRLSVAVALLMVWGCGEDASTNSSGPRPSMAGGLQFSDTPRPVAEARLRDVVDRLARTAIPTGIWRPIPSGSVDGYEPHNCADSTERATEFWSVPYQMIMRLSAEYDSAKVAAMLSRAERFLHEEGFSATRGHPAASLGRVAGSRDGFFVSVDVAEPTRNAIVEGTTPCVR